MALLKVGDERDASIDSKIPQPNRQLWSVSQRRSFGVKVASLQYQVASFELHCDLHRPGFKGGFRLQA
ncbi:hypothetical protein D9M70_563580 [compost metagenome]